MIVIDLETTGLNPRIHQILSIGAIDSDSGDTFYGECRIYKNDKVDKTALIVNGFTEDQIRDYRKQSPKSLYESFLKWTHGRSKMLGGCVVNFDISFLTKVHQSTQKNNRIPFHYRSLDLHSVAYKHLGKSLSLKEICISLGVEPEPEVHNALNGAIKAYECFKIML